MGEPEGALSYAEAARVIAQAQDYEEPLRRRTEGVTWVLWGLVTAGMVSSGSAVEWILPFPNPVLDWYWLLWLGVGVAGTKAVWSIAGVALPPTREGTKRSAAAMVAGFALLAAVWLAAWATVPVAALPAFMLLGLGTPWVLLGALNPQRSSSEGRKVMVAVGGLILAAGFAMVPFLPADHSVGFHMMSVAATAVGGGAPILGGLWQALRG